MNRFANRSPKTRPIIAIIVALAVPLVTAGIFIGVLSKPQENLDRVTAAIVNNDEPVELEGQTVPLGRQLAGGLVGGDGEDNPDSGYDWIVTNDEDAHDGLNSGEYGAIIEIPENFSAAATSTADDPSDAEKATISVTKSPRSRLMDEAVTQVIAAAATQVMGSELTETFLDNLFIGFNTLNSELGEAADGAHELDDGVNELASGSEELASGSEELAGGAGELSDGATELSGGVSELSNGTSGLASGASELAGGARDAAGGAQELAGGADDLSSGISEFSSGLGDLSGGAEELSGGLSELNDSLAFIPEGLAGLDEGIGELGAVADELKAAVEQQQQEMREQYEQICPVPSEMPELCGPLGDMIDQAPDADEISQGIDRIVAGMEDGVGQITGPDSPIVELVEGVDQLDQASGQLASGIDEAHGGAQGLAGGASDLAAGINELSSGVSDLSLGANELSAGAQELNGGVSQLDDGAQELDTGTTSLADAADQLADGAGELSSGTSELAEGSGELADGLDEAVDEIPTYPDGDREHLASVVSDPVSINGLDDDGLSGFDLGRSWVAFFTVIALWIGALWIYSGYPTAISNLRGSTKPSMVLSMKSLGLPAAVAVAQGLIVAILVAFTSSLSTGTWFIFAAVAVIIALAFLFVQRALLAAFNRVGLAISLAIAILGIATVVTSAMPTVASTIAAFTPIGPAISALQAIESGIGGLGGAVTGVIVWGIAGFLTYTYTIRRQRVAHLATT